jgi:hypothetical protein
VKSSRQFGLALFALGEDNLQKREKLFLCVIYRENDKKKFFFTLNVTAEAENFDFD